MTEPCGHPTACIVSTDEGTSYCGWCETNASNYWYSQFREMRKLVAELIDAMENEMIIHDSECGCYVHALLERARKA
jgi:kynureninase